LADQRPIQPNISRQRVRVPLQNKTALHQPPLNQAIARFESNRNRIGDQASVELAISFLPDLYTIGELQRQSRSELINRAMAYSSQYLSNCNSGPAKGGSTDTADQPVVMAGHQPELYHAGVWYKNFVLSELAERTGAIAINLVVDSDLSNQHSIRFPDLNAAPIRTRSIAIDKPAAAVPHEQRSIQDLSFMFALPSRINESMAGEGAHCIVGRLWPQVMEAHRKLSELTPAPNLGPTIAAGRHRFEQEVGLETLEVPVSQLCQTNAFAIFTAAIFDRANEFRQIYNQVLMEYRKVNRIRSNSHPVPELDQDVGWMEVPFWIYSHHTLGRERLFIRNLPDRFELSNRRQFNRALSKADFLSAFKKLSHVLSIVDVRYFHPWRWRCKIRSTDGCYLPTILCLPFTRVPDRVGNVSLAHSSPTGLQSGHHTTASSPPRTQLSP